MNKLTIINKMNNTFRKTGFTVRKHSPEILIVAGITGVIVSTVMACRATTKLNPVLNDAKDALWTIKEAAKYEEKGSLENDRKDIALVYLHTGVKVTKIYAPSVMLGVLSITSILASNNVLKKRNMALAAAYTAIDTSFKEYRTRVVERFGEEIDKELRFNAKARKVEEVIVDENGKEKKVKKTVSVMELNEDNEYAGYFDKTCNGYERCEPGLPDYYNMTFLRGQQAYANDKLKANGMLFLNDVYDMLGIKRSKAGQIVGWVYDPSNAVGDNFIDFRIREVHREIENEKTGDIDIVKTILLDFNVDGNVWDLM